MIEKIINFILFFICKNQTVEVVFEAFFTYFIKLLLLHLFSFFFKFNHLCIERLYIIKLKSAFISLNFF